MSNMQPMGNEKPGPPNFSGRYMASRIGSEASGNRPSMSSRFNGPFVPSPQPSYGFAGVGPYQCFSTPQIPPPMQSSPLFNGPPVGQPMLPPPTVPSTGQHGFQPPPVTFNPQAQFPSMPMAPPPQPQPQPQPPRGNLMQQTRNAPQFVLDSSFPAARLMSYGYPYRQAIPVTQGSPQVQKTAFLAIQLCK